MDYIKEEKERLLKQLNTYKPSEISRFFLISESLTLRHNYEWLFIIWHLIYFLIK